ncbi:class I adenylate-forming enzyme family protein [Bacillus dakarensis]|uniref:class I adenylate-forming enzyme family protein n=1 Tax=Robertmurraya dakarensis TaxID=1926278 RepID=UPI0009818504|nr:class I adenylate-forming enzyme family protein [Bacillus dakarensis]
MGNPIPRSLEYWAQIKPNDEAIIDENGYSLTWKEWNDQANRLADALVQAGIGPGDTVAVRSQIRPEWFVINRALAKIGCDQVGLNWHFKYSEALHVMKDSKAKVIIFDDSDPEELLPLWNHVPLVSMIGIHTLHHEKVQQFDDMIAERPVEERLSKRITPNFIIYTSGTTGHPKGVYRDPNLLDSRGDEVFEYKKDIEQKRGFSSSDNNRFLVNTPLHHGLAPGNAEITHQTGGSVVLLKKFDPVQTLELIMKYKINRWSCVPTIIKRIAQLPEDVLEKYDVSSIESLVIGAAPVPFSLKKWVISYFGKHCLYEGYGTSEVGLVSAMSPEMQLKKPGSSGLPYKHVEIHIRDENGKNLKAGEVGELWIKTPVTIDRYLNRSKLEADTLDPDGFFRTGDVGYVDEDGYLYISDRMKDMIISGGVNIYPAEIEAVLMKHPAIQDVAVIGVPNEEYGEEIKAICEINPKVSVTEAELIDFCRRELASYKRPRSVEFIEELPRNTVGKVLKRILRENYWKAKERKV